MADAAKLKTEERAGVCVVGFRDASILDVVTIQAIGRELYDLVESAGKKRIVLDFSDVRFLSSQALGVLLMLQRKSAKAGAKVALAGVRSELVRVFKLTNLDKLFQFFDRPDDAVTALSA